MTNALIKALMVVALYGALEITLFSSLIGRLARNAVRFRSRRMKLERRARMPLDYSGSSSSVDAST
jgi:hypothetical protein